MGLFGKKEANHNGLLNKIANPNPNGPGLLDRITNPNPNGKGLLGGLFGLFNRNKNTTQPTSFQEPTNKDNKSGSSW